MNIVGMCHICGRPAMNTCSLCGRLVCREHYDPYSGVCRACSRTMPDDGLMRGEGEEEGEAEDYSEFEDEY